METIRKTQGNHKENIFTPKQHTTCSPTPGNYFRENTNLKGNIRKPKRKHKETTRKTQGNHKEHSFTPKQRTKCSLTPGNYFRKTRKSKETMRKT